MSAGRLSPGAPAGGPEALADHRCWPFREGSPHRQGEGAGHLQGAEGGRCRSRWPDEWAGPGSGEPRQAVGLGGDRDVWLELLGGSACNGQRRRASCGRPVVAAGRLCSQTWTRRGGREQAQGGDLALVRVPTRRGCSGGGWAGEAEAAAAGSQLSARTRPGTVLPRGQPGLQHLLCPLLGHVAGCAVLLPGEAQWAQPPGS